ncbi:MAG TPA: hypothetical protein VEK34_09985 [Methylocella sp.]|nr:hypothetical protein [Methylocella sp.]
MPARSRLRRYLSRPAARGWLRIVGFYFVLLGSLAQLLPPQLHHVAAASQASTGCHFHAGHTSDGPPQNGSTGCPCCACLCCCSSLEAGLGLPPPEASHLTYAPVVASVSAPPALLGAFRPLLAHTWQSRAPPTLI